MTGVMSVLAQNGGEGGASMLIPLILMMVVFFFVLNAPRRKDEKRRKQMLKDLQKNDRVLTRGGVLGTVVGIKGNEITVKVDEATNAKMTLMRSYVDQVLTDEDREKMTTAAK